MDGNRMTGHGVDGTPSVTLLRDRLASGALDALALVDSYITEVSQDTWIFFPWDTDLQFVPPIAGEEGSANNRNDS